LKEFNEVVTNGKLEKEGSHSLLRLLGLSALVSPRLALRTFRLGYFLKWVETCLAVLVVDQLAIHRAENIEELINFGREEVGGQEKVQQIQQGLKGGLWDVTGEVEDKETAYRVRQGDRWACENLVLGHENVGKSRLAECWVGGWVVQVEVFRGIKEDIKVVFSFFSLWSSPLIKVSGQERINLVERAMIIWEVEGRRKKVESTKNGKRRTKSA
jgi:hypothetical protein